MKKFFCIFLLCVITVSMISCQNNNSSNLPDVQVTEPQKDRVKEVEDLIKDALSATAFGIAEEDYESCKKTVEKAEEAYNKLTQNEKDTLGEENKYILTWSRQILNIATARKVATEKAQNKIKKNLINPNSMQVNDTDCYIYYDKNTKAPVVVSITIDFSAQNGFGGYHRDTDYFYYKLNNDGSIYQEIGVSEYNSITDQSGVELFSFLLWDFKD